MNVTDNVTDRVTDNVVKSHLTRNFEPGTLNPEQQHPDSYREAAAAAACLAVGGSTSKLDFTKPGTLNLEPGTAAVGSGSSSPQLS